MLACVTILVYIQIIFQVSMLRFQEDNYDLLKIMDLNVK